MGIISYPEQRNSEENPRRENSYVEGGLEGKSSAHAETSGTNDPEGAAVADAEWVVEAEFNRVTRPEQSVSLDSSAENVLQDTVNIVDAELDRIARSELLNEFAEEALQDAASIIDAECDRLVRSEQPELLVERSAYSELVAYESAEELEDNINNFLMFFQEGFGEFYRERPCWGRFERLHEDLASSLRSVLAGYEGRFCDLPQQQKETILYAYEKMRELVSKNDPHVCDKNGRVDPHYLNR